MSDGDTKSLQMFGLDDCREDEQEKARKVFDLFADIYREILSGLFGKTNEIRKR